MLYDTIEKLEITILKLSYTLQAHKAYTSELADYRTALSFVVGVCDG